MSSQSPDSGGAERQFRDAFERLKQSAPMRLPKGALVTQNNVAREAGKDPSALKKDRFPALIREIQRWISAQPKRNTQSVRQVLRSSRERMQELKERIEQLRSERDTALSMLVSADSKIVELTMELLRLKPVEPDPPTVLPFRKTSSPAKVK